MSLASEDLADTAFDDFSSLLAAVLWACLVVKAISATE